MVVFSSSNQGKQLSILVFLIELHLSNLKNGSYLGFFLTKCVTLLKDFVGKLLVKNVQCTFIATPFSLLSISKTKRITANHCAI